MLCKQVAAMTKCVADLEIDCEDYFDWELAVAMNLFERDLGSFDRLEVERDYINAKMTSARTIIDLAYLSTDTVERGASIYNHALTNVYHCFRLNPDIPGALETVLILMAALGYDNAMISILRLYVQQQQQEQGMRQMMAFSPGVDSLWLWIPEVNARKQTIDPADQEEMTNYYKSATGCLCTLLVKLRLLASHRRHKAQLDAFGQTGLGHISPIQSLVDDYLVGDNDVEFETWLLTEIKSIVAWMARIRGGPILLQAIPPDGPNLSMHQLYVYFSLVEDASDELRRIVAAEEEMTRNATSDEYTDFDPSSSPIAIEPPKIDFTTLWMILKDGFCLTPGVMDVFLEFTPQDDDDEPHEERLPLTSENVQRHLLNLEASDGEEGGGID
jgi:hypothetical protein